MFFINMTVTSTTILMPCLIRQSGQSRTGVGTAVQVEEVIVTADVVVVVVEHFPASVNGVKM